MLYRCSSADKLFLYIFLFSAVLFLFLTETKADVIKLKTGREIQGIIQQETEDKVIIEFQLGKMTLVKDNVESIDRASKEENDLLRQKWEDDKQKTKKSREYTDKIERGVALAPKGYGKIEFGMSRERVKQILQEKEKGIIDETKRYILTTGELFGEEGYIFYNFTPVTEKCAGISIFLSDSSETIYDKVKKALVEKYGEPSLKTIDGRSSFLWKWGNITLALYPPPQYSLGVDYNDLDLWIKSAKEQEERIMPKEEDFAEKIKVKYRTFVEVNKIEKLDKEKMIEKMRNATVTIFAGSRRGSGFLISEDGYLLTNEHVVSGTRFVQVKFVTGRELRGEVIRVNEFRDAALVKLEKDIYPYLPLGSGSKIDVGEDVYAIGTPLSEELSQTVTKGIVSSFRAVHGLQYIQSDVNIAPGNSGGPLVSIKNGVIGICVAGMSIGRVTLGYNFFISIEEAIEGLGMAQDF